ncbi:MAG: dihydropyrimidinase, partial [Actinobacteria bacterium]|nr:dihydropyrimidinase [Actinomycetota bacterium]
MKTLIKNGRIVTAADNYVADLLIENGRVTAIGQGLAVSDAQVIDASGKYVLPGGIDVHTHNEMPFGGTISADDFESGTIAAAAGGTTCIVDWALQSKGGTLAQGLATWKEKARGKAVIDYGFHIAINELTDGVIAEIPSIVEEGVSSLKCFMAYKGVLQVDDATLFKSLLKSKEAGAIFCVHAENGDVIDVLVKQALAKGETGPLYHALTRPPEAEGEATGRAIALAEMAGAPLYIVHLSASHALGKVKAARDKGLPIFAETCPHYLFLDHSRYELPGFESAKFVCSPPIREKRHQDVLWSGLANGSLATVGSDHCPFNFKGQKELGLNDFSKIPNGAPGVEHRVVLTYQGVLSGKISLSKFVEVVSTNPANGSL